MGFIWTAQTSSFRLFFTMVDHALLDKFNSLRKIPHPDTIFSLISIYGIDPLNSKRLGHFKFYYDLYWPLYLGAEITWKLSIPSSKFLLPRFCRSSKEACTVASCQNILIWSCSCTEQKDMMVQSRYVNKLFKFGARIVHS